MKKIRDILLDLVVALDERASARQVPGPVTGELLPPPRGLEPPGLVRTTTWAAPTGEPLAHGQPGQDEFFEAKQFVVVRYRDGKAWAGPWRGNGDLFSSVPSKWCVFSDYESAKKEALRSEFNFRVDVLEM